MSSSKECKDIQHRKNDGFVAQSVQSVKDLVNLIGVSKEAMLEDWVRRLAIFNGSAYFLSIFGQLKDKYRHPLPNGERKVAVFSVMNFKYVGLLKVALFVHILGGVASVLAGTSAIFYEKKDSKKSKRLAYIASIAETFLHGPSALALSPFVYGDRKITSYLYAFTSTLLIISGASALIETSEDRCEKDFGGARPELRRMQSTVSIFLYVRLYAAFFGVGGFLQDQKYTLAVMTSGFTMLPIGWKRWMFPLGFWGLAGYNYDNFLKTIRLIEAHGIDGAAAIQQKLA